MLVTLLIIAPFAIALAVLTLASRASRRSRVAAGGPAVPPRPGAPRGTARPEIQASDERQPFEADNGLIIGEAGQP
jgi:hypothetical protein